MDRETFRETMREGLSLVSVALNLAAAQAISVDDWRNKENQVLDAFLEGLKTQGLAIVDGRTGEAY